MRQTARLILAALLFAAPLLTAQTPASTSAQSPAPAPTAPAMKTWFIRLIPPRPDFDKTLTDAETKLMQEHFVYWKDLNAKGICIFGGPVLDPKGVFGVIVVRAASEEDARALGSGDPTVKGGVKHIEVAEMKVAFVPKAH